MLESKKVRGKKVRKKVADNASVELPDENVVAMREGLQWK